MRNVREADFDPIARAVVAVGTDYPSDHQLGWHSHRRAQLLYGATGLMQVDTEQGSWTVPPHRAVWIPAGTPHAVRMLGVSTRSAYIEPSACIGMPEHCQVLHVSALMRELLMRAVDMPPHYEEAGRDGLAMALLLAELRALPALPLHLPLPRDPATLRARCRDFLARPAQSESAERWARDLNVSPRTLTRLFQRETGMSFLAWRQRACVLSALPRLAAGDSVMAIAIDLGYDSPGAFATVFKRLLGESPSRYGRASGSSPARP